MADLTQFDVQSARRIARVVRAAERPAQNASALEFDRPEVMARAKVFRVCKFDGDWGINVDKEVRIGQTTATLSVRNLFFPIDNTAASDVNCAVAKDGTAWYLVDVPMEQREGVFVTGAIERRFVASTAAATVVTGTYKDSVVIGVSVAAQLNTTNCTIDVFTTNHTAQHTFAIDAQEIAVPASISSGLFVTSTQRQKYLVLKT